MTERRYAFRLVIHGDIVYENTIEQESAMCALEWGLYWMPGGWFQTSRGEPVCAEIRVIRDDGQYGSWRTFTSTYLRRAASISRFTDEDLKCLVAGQTLVWQIFNGDGTPVHGKIFDSRGSAVDFMRDEDIWSKCYVDHVWVDGWFDEQYSWKRTEVKGYKGLTMEKKKEEE